MKKLKNTWSQNVKESEKKGCDLSFIWIHTKGKWGPVLCRDPSSNQVWWESVRYLLNYVDKTNQPTDMGLILKVISCSYECPFCNFLFVIKKSTGIMNDEWTITSLSTFHCAPLITSSVFKPSMNPSVPQILASVGCLCRASIRTKQSLDVTPKFTSINVVLNAIASLLSYTTISPVFLTACPRWVQAWDVCSQQKQRNCSELLQQQ